MVLILFFCAKLVVSPLTLSFVISGNFKENLLWNIVLFFTLIALMMYSDVYNLSYLELLKFYSINYLILYVIWLFRCHSFSKRNTSYLA